MMICAECNRQIASGQTVNGRMCCEWCLPDHLKIKPWAPVASSSAKSPEFDRAALEAAECLDKNLTDCCGPKGVVPSFCAGAAWARDRLAFPTVNIPNGDSIATLLELAEHDRDVYRQRSEAYREELEALKADAEHYFKLIKETPTDVYSMGRYDTYKWVHEKTSEALADQYDASRKP